ncbi:hypothetical protein QJ857_gp0190 [Tupanvirus soda lake]|uniref:Lipocalin/cytosolic fatty-acid binding domain-containing protein n=2 Tax=Tupanvirus TaxID=2094720 RepID=A0A6N1NN79_9VIRU|nr:hypothetical protein QJ857_gp0190 [Tupanvirus soda lake]QKU35834.1 hypothetical protein [Tupanvirus soda lake]
MSIWTIILIVAIVLIIVYWFNPKQNNGQTNMPNIPITNVDLNKYQGVWYEIARLPTVFQKGCTNTTAIYTLNPNKTIGVTNQCQIGNRVVRVDGIAYPNYGEISSGSNVYPGSFTVIFNNDMLPSNMHLESKKGGDYNVILVDPEYRYALVGTKNRDNLWFLSRTKNMDQVTFNHYVKVAQTLGYRTNNLEFTQL